MNHLMTGARLFSCLLAALAMLSCGRLDEGNGAAFDIKDFQGTVKNSFPIAWERGRATPVWRGTFDTELRSYNPFASLDGSAYSGVLVYILDYLFTYDVDKREWKGEQVKNFEVKFDKAKDTMELLCELRDDIFWSDGTPMTADDVVYHHMQLDGDKDFNFRGYFAQLVKMDDGTEKRVTCEKIDRYKFRFIFPRIINNPVLLVNNMILPRHVWEPVVKRGKDAVLSFWSINTPPESIVGNGPYVVEEYKPAERLVFKKNPRYWKKDDWGNSLPYRERVVQSFVPPGNQTANLLKFQKGEIEYYSMRGKDMATLLPEAPKKRFAIWNGGPAERYSALVFNQKPGKVKEPVRRLFMDKRFRQAVSSLIDRQTIINQVSNGLGEPFYHFVTDLNRYFNPAFATPFSYNPAKARELLEALDLRDRNGDSFLEDKEGNTVEFKMMLYGNEQTIIDTYNIMIDEFKKAGLKAEMETLDYNVWAERLQFTQDWQCVVYSWSAPLFTDQYSNVWPSSGDRHAWNPEQEKPATEWEARIDELYRQLTHTFDPGDVQKLYDEFQRIIMDELPMIPISRRYEFTAVYSKWGNFNWDSRHDAGGDTGGTRIYLRDKPEQ